MKSHFIRMIANESNALNKCSFHKNYPTHQKVLLQNQHLSFNVLTMTIFQKISAVVLSCKNLCFLKDCLLFHSHNTFCCLSFWTNFTISFTSLINFKHQNQKKMSSIFFKCLIPVIRRLMMHILIIFFFFCIFCALLFS